MKASFVIGEKLDGSYELIQIGGDAEQSNQAYLKATADFAEVAFFRKPQAFKRRFPARIAAETVRQNALHAEQVAKEAEQAAEEAKIEAEKAVEKTVKEAKKPGKRA